MGRMIGFEFQKIWSRRIVWVGLGLLLVLNLFGTFVNGSTVVTPDGRELRGKEADAYVEKSTEKYAGLLNDEKKERILKEEKPAEIVEYAYLYGTPMYSSMRENFEADYGPFYGMTVDEAFTQRGITVEVGNTEAWMDTFSYLQTLMLGLCTVVVIGISGVFSEEYTRKMDALLLTSRHGKKRCVWAKIIASFLFAVISYGAFILTIAIPFLVKNGISGWNAGVQLDTVVGLFEVPYTLNCGEAALLLVAGGFLGTVMLTAVTLTVSVLSKSSFVAVIVSAVLYFAPPMCAQFVELKYVALTPLGAGLNGVLTLPKFSVGGVEMLFYVKILLVAVILTIVAGFTSRRIFAMHQVN